MKVLMIRHGKPTYDACTVRNFIGHGRDMAHLTPEGIGKVKNIAKDERLKKAQLILSSPYTRALQTAAIISKEIGIDIQVELDLHEWLPDKTFQYKNATEVEDLHKEFDENHGIYPEENHNKIWESLTDMQQRVKNVLHKYYGKYDEIIMVSHGMVMRSLKHQEVIDYAEIIEYNYYQEVAFPTWKP